jgi:Rieske 2Fe-2S family protein
MNNAMNAEAASNSVLVAHLVRQQALGRSLAQPFYTSDAVFRHDMDTVFMRHWLCLGHESQVTKPGDFLTHNIGSESVIVVRDREGVVRAFANVCRHRGSRICSKESGNTAMLVCPYHAWTYDLTGKLRAIPHAGELAGAVSDPDNSLQALHLRIVQGLLFVSFAQKPLDFSEVERAIDGAYGPYGWNKAKVAYRETYKISANWKLAVENYVECYHCGPSHPEYSTLHALAQPTERIQAMNDAMSLRTASNGVDIPFVEFWSQSTQAGAEAVCSFRYALYDGIQTGSDGGKPVAPLMGRFKSYDGGVTSTHVGPASFLVAYADYGVIYRFAPLTLQTCEMELIWLVAEDAVEGSDYDLDKLTWLWCVTSDSDKRIVEENQRGVNSRFYRPGPFAPMEKNARRYVEWYLNEIGNDTR